MVWDVFVSHASEDKEAVARPLARRLELAGFRVWLDEAELTLGDRLRQKIDDGLAHSRFGVVVLSPAFFSKHWPPVELDGLAALEVSGRKVILPVWHGLDETAVRAHSPLLAGRLAVSTDGGLDRVAAEVAKVLRQQPQPHLDRKIAATKGKRWNVSRTFGRRNALVLFTAAVLLALFGAAALRLQPIAQVSIGTVLRSWLTRNPETNQSSKQSQDVNLVPQSTRTEGDSKTKSAEPPRAGGMSVRRSDGAPGGAPVVERSYGAESRNSVLLTSRAPNNKLVDFVEIPAGKFLMGSDKALDQFASNDEVPQHEVTLPEFFIGRTEVTVGEYAVCVRDGGCSELKVMARGRDDLPLTRMTWYEARAYCEWLESKLKVWADTPEGVRKALRRTDQLRRVSLPSEAEWERAARGTDGRMFPWGNNAELKYANYQGSELMPVGSFPAGATPEGVLDMAGNVEEWTRRHRAPYPYRPDDGRESLRADRMVERATRGSAYVGGSQSIRAARRSFESPDQAWVGRGFRVVVSSQVTY